MLLIYLVLGIVLVKLFVMIGDFCYNWFWILMGNFCVNVFVLKVGGLFVGV